MSSTAHRVPAPDGWVLDVLDLEPAGPARGVVVAGHAMMVDRRTFRPGKPGLARTLVDAGLRVLLPDLRGHGRSGPTPRAGGREVDEVDEAELGAVDPVAARAREAGDRPALVGGVEAAEAAGTGEFGRCGHGQGATV